MTQKILFPPTPVKGRTFAERFALLCYAWELFPHAFEITYQKRTNRFCVELLNDDAEDYNEIIADKNNEKFSVYDRDAYLSAESHARKDSTPMHDYHLNNIHEMIKEDPHCIEDYLFEREKEDALIAHLARQTAPDALL